MEFELSIEACEQAVEGVCEGQFWFMDHGYPHVLARVTCPDGMIEERKSISKRARFRIFTRDKFTCQYCGAKPPEVVLVVDHVVPVSKGGRTVSLNLITSCEPCNQGKTDKTFDVRLACFYLEAIANKIGHYGY